MRAGAAVALSVAAAVPAVAEAQEQAREARVAAEKVQSRFIGEWAYVPVTVVQGPFATTYVSSTTGLGGYTLDIDFDLPPPVDTRTRDLAYIAAFQRFDVQIPFLHRFAVRADLQGEFVIPDTGQSALSLALTGNWGVGGGVLVQLLADDRLMLSVTGDYLYLQRSVVSPAGALQDTLQGLRFGALFTNQEIHRVTGLGSFALRFTDWVGFVAEAGWEGEWPEATGVFADQDESLHFLPIAGAVSANFWEWRFPLGATLFWRERIPLGGDNRFDYSRQFGGGLFYTGRPWLDAGLELFRQDEEQEAGNLLRKASRYYIAPRIRGYF